MKNKKNILLLAGIILLMFSFISMNAIIIALSLLVIVAWVIVWFVIRWYNKNKTPTNKPDLDEKVTIEVKETVDEKIYEEKQKGNGKKIKFENELFELNINSKLEKEYFCVCFDLNQNNASFEYEGLVIGKVDFYFMKIIDDVTEKVAKTYYGGRKYSFKLKKFNYNPYLHKAIRIMVFEIGVELEGF